MSRTGLAPGPPAAAAAATRPLATAGCIVAFDPYRLARPTSVPARCANRQALRLAAERASAYGPVGHVISARMTTGDSRSRVAVDGGIGEEEKRQQEW